VEILGGVTFIDACQKNSCFSDKNPQNKEQPEGRLLFITLWKLACKPHQEVLGGLW
jgi:hypothetical protein